MTLVQRVILLAEAIRDVFNEYQSGARKPKISLFLDDGATGKSYNDIVNQVSAAIQTAINDIKGGVGATADTLKKLDDKIIAITGGGYATELYVDTAIQNVVGAAPALIDTIKEVADALGNDPNFATTILGQLAAKANAADVYTQIQANTLFKLKSEYDNEIGVPDTDFVVVFNTGLL